MSSVRLSNLRGKGILLFAWLLVLAGWGGQRGRVACAVCLLPGDSYVDSLLLLTKSEDCASRVRAWELLCNRVYVEDSSELELAYLRQFEEAARKCGDTKNQLYARMWRLSSYYNYAMRDSFFIASEEALLLFERYGHERYRYEAYRLRVLYHLFSNEFQYALREAENMVLMAQKEGCRYGLGVSYYTLGYVYQLLYASEVAVSHYRKALLYLTKKENQHIESRLRCWAQLAECYAEHNACGQLDSVNTQWQLEMQEYGVDMRNVTENNPWLLFIQKLHLSRVRYWLSCDSLSTARCYLDSAASFALGSDGTELALLAEQEAWYHKAGVLDSALAKNSRLLLMSHDKDAARSRLAHEQMRARLLYGLGRYEESARLYDSLVEVRNAADELSVMRATTELSSILANERAQRRVLKIRLYALVAGLLVVFSLTLAFISMRRSRKIRQKNRLLVETVERLAISHDAIEEIQQQQTIEKAEDRERELYERLEELMRKKHIYLDAKLNREMLARELGTNSTYLAAAIKACRPNTTVGEYIALWRVVYAVHLLRTTDLRISEIAEQSGFQSRAIMNRAFNSLYGMSPTEYKDALLE